MKQKDVEKKMLNEMVKQINRKILDKFENIWFTSDTHFGDERLNLFGRDIIFKNSKEVDENIKKNWNEKVGENDLIIHVGDVALTEDGLKFIDELNGTKWLIKGNYDISEGTAKYKVSDEKLLKYFKRVFNYLTIEIGGEPVFINHYPTNAKENIFNIVGHIHGTWKVNRNMINVGVDAWHFSPVSLKQIEFQMNGIRKHYDQNVFAGELKSNTNFIKGEVKVIRPPEYCKVSDIDNKSNFYIFLAGPIQGARNWQNEVIEQLQKKLENIDLQFNVILSSPRREERVTDDNFDYNEQVSWESFYLEKASKNGIIVFFLAKEKEKIQGRTYAQTTRFELGEWWAKGQKIPQFKIVVGLEKGFDGGKYIKYKFNEKYESIIKESLEGVVNEIKNLIKKENEKDRI